MDHARIALLALVGMTSLAHTGCGSELRSRQREVQLTSELSVHEDGARWPLPRTVEKPG
jgi:hypothetical protein